ncbi:hypothetical protein [Lacrimispora sp.]|uniref:hypothetical protein n=1 Tax=Lacrimispora sp. TaxID=2719234 RepID=UPI00345F965D
MARAVGVTDSYVSYGWIHNGNFLRVDGFVTMKNGSADAYHYTRVQCEHKSTGSVLEKVGMNIDGEKFGRVRP